LLARCLSNMLNCSLRWCASSVLRLTDDELKNINKKWLDLKVALTLTIISQGFRTNWTKEVSIYILWRVDYVYI